MSSTYYKSCWEAYRTLVDAGVLAPQQHAYFSLQSNRHTRGLLPTAREVSQKIAEVTLIEKLLQEKTTERLSMNITREEKERKLVQIGVNFVDATFNADTKRFREIVSSGFNVNFIHPIKGYAAIHCIAHGRSRILIHAFLKAKNIDFLLKAKNGEVPSQIARRASGDFRLVRFWETMEKRQAKQRKIDWHTYIN